MLIRLDKIVDAPFEWRSKRSIPVEVLERAELLELSEIDWKGQVEPSEAGYRLQGEISYRQTLTCARCLAPIEQPVTGTFELSLRVGELQPPEAEHELSEDEFDVLNLESSELDLDSILLEQLQLNIPMTSLCTEDCAGICPACGSDRNKQPCRCEDDNIDPRWRALKSISDN